MTGLGYNYRLDEPRAALLLSRLNGLEEDIAARRRLTHRYRALLDDVEGVTVPYRPEPVDASSCYVMPVMLDEPARRDPLRVHLSEEHGVQTSVLYPRSTSSRRTRAAVPAACREPSTRRGRS